MRLFLALAAALFLALPAAAHDGVHIVDPYARILSTGSGVVYFTINNHADNADVLLSAHTDIGTTMLMTSAEDASGVMSMTMVMDGFAIGPMESRFLQPAGDHVMLTGLTNPPAQGETLNLILTFRNAGEVHLTVPVDNKRFTPPGTGPTPYDMTSD